MSNFNTIALSLDQLPEFRNSYLEDSVSLVSSLCDATICAVSFTEPYRRWLGPPMRSSAKGIRLQDPFFKFTLDQKDLVVVPDLREDSRFSDGAADASANPIRFYAGIPLEVQEHGVGTLFVVDLKPRTLSAAQQNGLRAIARQIGNFLVLDELSRRLPNPASPVALDREIPGHVIHEINNALTIIGSGTERIGSLMKSGSLDLAALDGISERIDLAVQRIAKVAKGLNPLTRAPALSVFKG